MGFTTLQNTPVVLDLVMQAKTTGWTIAGGVATHEACNAGYLDVNLDSLTVITGISYAITYQITDITSGSIQLSIGNSLGISRTIAGNYAEILQATGINPLIRFFSNGNLNLKLLDIQPTTTSDLTNQPNTIVFSEVTNKYTSHFPFTSDYGFGMFEFLYTFKNGKLYFHDESLEQRNIIYGVQYNTTVKVPFNMYKGQPKTFESVTYDANMLLITTVDGITTSLGQISELIADDFLHETLNDGVNQINIYDNEGIYSASFVRDSTDDINTGADLKGTYTVIEFVTTSNSILKLSNIIVNSVVSAIGTR